MCYKEARSEPGYMHASTSHNVRFSIAQHLLSKPPHLPRFADMGRPDSQPLRKQQTLAVTTTADGAINYDALLKQGANRNKIIHSDHRALVPKVDDLNKEFEKPDEEEVKKAAAETAAALGVLVDKKVAALQPKNLPTQPGGPQYIKYTPSQQGVQYASGAGQRIIRMQVRSGSGLGSRVLNRVRDKAAHHPHARPLLLGGPSSPRMQSASLMPCSSLQHPWHALFSPANPNQPPPPPPPPVACSPTPSTANTPTPPPIACLPTPDTATPPHRPQEMPVDPMEPPKFRHTKVPRGPGSPPVPIMHSPPRPVSAKEAAEWKVPPCVSNWKNAKGYTIPLDKRLAADGRGLQDVTINDKFASFAESLYVAEKKAREAVEARRAVKMEVINKQKAQKEQELRELAIRARMERGGMGGGGMGGGGLAARADGGLPPPPPIPSAPVTGGYSNTGRSPQDSDDEDDRPGPAGRAEAGGYRESREEREARRQRDDIREERRRERERERRLESRDAHPSKKSKLTRDRDRDVGEKMALGMAKVGGAGEVMYDSRLFNQEAGMASGFHTDDAYNMYDKPLFADRGDKLYRPKAADDTEVYGGAAGGGDEVRTDRFKADKGFAGADTSAGPRSAPVEFERNAPEADPFGLDQFMSEMKTGSKRSGKPLDGIGKGGGMAASAGGGTGDGSSGRRMDFTKGRP